MYKRCISIQYVIGRINKNPGIIKQKRVPHQLSAKSRNEADAPKPKPICINPKKRATVVYDLRYK